MANRGALTPTPQMMFPSGDLFIRRDDLIYGLRGLILTLAQIRITRKTVSIDFFLEIMMLL